MFGVICNEKSETGKDEKVLEAGVGGGWGVGWFPIPYSGFPPYAELLSSLSQYHFSPNTALGAEILANPLSGVAVKSVSRQEIIRFLNFVYSESDW